MCPVVKSGAVPERPEALLARLRQGVVSQPGEQSSASIGFHLEARIHSGERMHTWGDQSYVLLSSVLLSCNQLC